MFDSQQLGLCLGPLYVSLFGHQARMITDEGREASRLAVQLGANPSKICRLIVASNQHQEGFQLAKVADYIEFVNADSVILTEAKSAALIQVADCPVGVLYDKKTNRAVVFHGGRPALTPFCKESSPACDWTIVEDALTHVTAGGSADSVQALVLGNICGQCFVHDHKEAKHLISPFVPLGEKVFANMETGALDLYAVIKHRLMHGGVAEENIQHAGPCSFETPSFSSHRRGDDDRNTVMVVWR